MSAMSRRGHLRKMVANCPELVRYQLVLDDQSLPLDDALGKSLVIRFTGVIQCQHCGRRTKKSFGQGYCYPCFTRLAQCDRCIFSPETCHYFEGTCREPHWGESHCMVNHIVYLANSSGVKVGITRESQIPTRWIDQGATQALPILRVATRQQAGLVEDILREHVKDRTDWRAMLKGEAEPVDLSTVRDTLLDRCDRQLTDLKDRFGLEALQPLENVATLGINYPVLEYPSKITGFNLDKNPLVEGLLLGIKGQYLILDAGVINIRKHTAYQVDVTID